MPVPGVEATYSMIGATTPSVAGGITSASVLDSTLKVDFGTSSAQFYAKWGLNGGGTTWETPNGGMAISRNGAHLSGFAGCGYTLEVAGFLAGDGASRAGMAYYLSLFGNLSGTATGAIAYQRGALTPASPPPPP
jgi:hypothetical protein